MRLYDKNGNPVEVPDNQVVQALESGQFGLPKGQATTLRQAGKRVSDTYEVDNVQDVIDMYKRGFRAETDQEIYQRDLQKEYGGTFDQVAAGAAGVMRGLTFGLSDQLITAADPKQEKNLSKLKEANPDVSQGSEIGAVLGSMIIPGGQSKALGLLRGAGAAPRAVAKLGNMVERGTIKMLGGAKGGLVRRALVKGGGLGAAGAVEGSIYGAGQFISEEALGETEGTAENLLGYIGTGAMWGGAGGSAFGVGGELIKKGLGTGKAFISRSAKSVKNMYEKARGIKAVDGLEEAIEGMQKGPGKYSETVGTLIQEDPTNIHRLLNDKDALRTAASSKKTREVFNRELSDARDRLDELLEDLTEQTKGRMKKENMAAIMNVDDKVATMASAQNTLRQMKDEIGNMRALGRGSYEGQAALRQADDYLDSYIQRLDEMARTKADDALPDAFHILDNAKRDIGKIRQKLGRVRLESAAHQATMGKLEDIYQVVRTNLEDSALWGKAAEAQRAINAPWSTIIGKSRTLGREFGKAVDEIDWHKVYKTDRAKMAKFIDNLGLPQNDVYEQYFMNKTVHEMKLVDVLGKHFEMTPALQRKVDEFWKTARNFDDTLKKTRNTVGLQNQLSDIVTASNRLQGLMPAAGLAGYMLGGEEGAVLGLGLSVLTNPGRLLQMKAAINRMQEQFSLKMSTGLKDYMKKATGKLKKVKTRQAITPLSLKVLGDSNWGDKRTKDKNRQEAFKRRVSELRDFLSNPAKTEKVLVDNTGDLSEVTPKMATAMQIKAAQTAKWLYDKAPKPPHRGTMTTNDKWTPADHELAKWERYAAAATDPLSIVDDMRAGRLTIEGVEAVRENYPHIYSQMVETVAENLPELREELPYKERVQLSIFFGVPVDETMDKQFVATMQMVGQGQQQQEMPGMPGQPQPKRRKPRANAFRKMEVDKTAMTPSQRLMMG